MSRFVVPDYSTITIPEAIAIQEQLRAQVICEDDLGSIRTVAGVDIGLDLSTSTARAAVVVLRLPELTVEEQIIATRPITFPYVPGLLGFREVPAALDALSQLRALPDLLLCDGQGIAHPRRFGLACHLGLLAGLPAIGAAKSRLIGTHKPVSDERGAWQPLYDGREMIGVALRTRPHANPLYISPGHRISLTSVIEYVLRCTTTYRLPEPARRAHQLASAKPSP